LPNERSPGASDPLYAARRTLHTGAGLLTGKQKQRLENLFATDEHVQVEAAWGIYQRKIAADREPDQARGHGCGRELMRAVIDLVSHGVPSALTELITLGRTLTKRAADVLAYFDRPGTSNGPTEASTAGSNTSAAPPSASATSPITALMSIAPGDRRLQTPTTPRNVKSHQSSPRPPTAPERLGWFSLQPGPQTGRYSPRSVALKHDFPSEPRSGTASGETGAQRT
jgi:hypothetical protein